MMKFPKQLLIDLLDCVPDPDGLFNDPSNYVEDDEKQYCVIESVMCDQRRWVTVYRMVFMCKNDRRYYVSHYDVGSTEMQDQSPYEDDGDLIECRQVFEREITTKVYETVAETLKRERPL